MERGDILAVDLPAPGSRPGREQVGRRPGIVVQAEAQNEKLPTIMIVPFTRNLSALRFPLTFQIDPSPQNGLNSPSVLLVFQLRAIDKKRLGNEIGRLEEHYLQQLNVKMRELLAL